MNENEPEPGSGSSEESQKIFDLDHLVNKAIHDLDEHSRDTSGKYVLTTGFDALDNLTGGWEPGELVAVGSRAAMGKTSLLLSMIKNIRQKSIHPIGFISLELSNAQLAKRILSAEAEIPISKIKKAKLKIADWDRIFDNATLSRKSKIYIADNPKFSMDGIKSAAAEMVDKYGIRILFIDYLQLIDSVRSRINKVQAVSTVIRKLKLMARELNLVIIFASQLNRTAELRSGNMRPRLCDLKDSGAIEEDSDKVILLFRPDFYDIFEDERGNSTVGLAELIIAKNRTGPTGSVFLRFDSKFGRFSEINHDQAPRLTAYRNDFPDQDSPF